jgi:hypothetical protein
MGEQRQMHSEYEIMVCRWLRGLFGHRSDECRVLWKSSSFGGHTEMWHICSQEGMQHVSMI